MISGLYFITDSRLTKQGIAADVEQVIKAGCRLIQYREKEKNTSEMVKEATQLAKLCKANTTLFIINNRVDIALAVDADGVHIGQSDMAVETARKLLGKNKIIGKSTHSVEEAVQAEKQGCNYVSVGPVFHTNTKKDAGKPVGVELVTKIKKAVNLPVVAIGGINEENLEQVLKAGPDSIAMISAIACSPSPEKAAKTIIEKIQAFK